MKTFKEFYSNLLESIELRKPANARYIRNRKTSYGVGDSYQFTTSKGNTVDIFYYFKESIESVDRNNRIYDITIIFTVNGSDYHRANESERDIEILSGVFYLIVQYVNQHFNQIHTIFINANKNQKDYNLNKNRRFSIYKRLFTKYLGSKWDIHSSEGHWDTITLTKKL